MMIRLIYACLVGLHPRSFRQRFAEEMLWIYDQAAGKRGAGPLVADAFISLLRQWVLRAGLWERPAISGAVGQDLDGVPVFYTCGSSMPRLGALLNGAVLSLAAFSAVSLAIGHGGGHGTLRAAMVGLPSPAVWSSGGAVSLGLRRQPETAMCLHPVLAALDADHDGEISASEIQNASAALKTLDKNGDGKLTANELLPDAGSCR